MKDELSITEPKYDRSVILPRGGGFFRGIVNGQPAWSNGCMMEIGRVRPHFRTGKAWSTHSPDFQQVVDNACASGYIPTDDAKLTGIDKMRLGGTVHLNYHYWAYFRQHYPLCVFAIANHEPPWVVIVLTDNKLVGLIAALSG